MTSCCRGGRVVAALSAAVLIAAACGGGSSRSSRSFNGATAKANRDPVAVSTYGYGPSADARAHLASDVVVVDGGPGAVRSATADGLTWTIDRAADGASKLHVGSVMLLTSRAAGRVAVLRDVGSNRIVTLAPVELGELLPNGSIGYSGPLSFQGFSYQPVPGRPGALSEPAPGDIPVRPPPAGAAPTSARGVVRLPTIELVAAKTPAPGTLPVARKTSVEIPIGDWKVKPTVGSDGLGLEVEREGNLKVGLAIAFQADDLHVDAGETENGGKATRSRLLLRGLNGLDVSLKAGAANGELDNSKVKIEVPVDIDLPIPPSPATAGLPADVKIEFKFAVETALTGQNATEFASGSYGLSGPLGIDDGKIVTPSFSVKKSIIDSIGGITLGPSGIVFSVGLKVLFGLGVPPAKAGPYGLITASIGVTNGSSLGAALARCHGASLDIDIGGGAEISVSAAASDLLSALLPKGTKFEHGLEIKKTIIHREQVVPDVPLCNSS